MIGHSMNLSNRLHPLIRAATMLVVVALPAVAQIPPAERDALIALHDSTNGAEWTNRAGWLGAAGTECSWYGVACSGGRVSSISLPSNQLQGSLPPEMGALSGLQDLWLSENRLSGSIPAELGDLTSARYIALDRNELGGSIPSQLGNLANLRDLYLNSNQLSGTIPAQLGDLANLQHLWLSANQLSGSIPAEIGKLSNLVDLWFSSNQLSGSIPGELGKLSSLERLWLSANQLSGSIPEELGNLPSLQRLWLESNQLSGSIPPQLGNASLLHYIRLHSNRLSGSIPAELGKLSRLQYLWLSSNQLSGAIPEELGDLTGLQRLWLESNVLTGSIPAELGKLSSLQDLRLSANQLTGSIPAQLGTLSNLVRLALGGNRLTGSIPAELGNLSMLRYLSLDRNDLSGGIPPAIGSLSNVQEVALDHNRLGGTIPAELGNLSSLRYLALDHNQVSGSIPVELRTLAGLQYLYLDFNRLSGNIPAELGDLSSLLALSIGSNQLKGRIPSELTNLSNVSKGALNLAYNALYTDDETVREFINSRHASGEFEATQTVAPSDLRVAAATPTSLTLQWTLIRFNIFAGSYRIHIATAPDGPFSFVTSTRDKFATGAIVPNLTPFTTYYIRMDTFTGPHVLQQNAIVSDSGSVIVATTGAPVPEIAVVAPPEGMTAFADGVSIAGTTLSVANLGTAATTVTLTPSGSFFTLEAAIVALGPAATATVPIRSHPVSTPGDYRGTISLSGIGVRPGLTVPVTLFGAPPPPAGEPIVEVVSTRVDVSAPIDVNPSGAVAFRNVGSATARGILQSDQPWIIPEGSVLAIEPGQTRSFSFTIDRAKRPDADSLSGSQEGSLVFVYVSGASLGASGWDPFSGVPGLVAPVRIGDTIRPKGKDFCAGGCVNGVPLLKNGEVGLVVAGIGHISGSVGLFASNVTISNRSGLPVDDLALFFAGKAVEQPIAAGRWTSLADVAATAFEETERLGALHLRSWSARELAMSATVFVKTNPAGTFGSALPVFRTDEGAANGETVAITGLRKTSTSHTNLYLQEIRGADSRARVEFLDSGGGVLDTLSDAAVPAFGTTIIGQALVPEGSVTARVTNTGGGALAAFATPVDRASNDTWVVADWGQVYDFKRIDGQFVAVAGSAPGRNDTYFQTDVAIHALSSGEAIVRYHQQTPTALAAEASLSFVAGETKIFDDVLVSLFAAPIPSLGSVEVIPGEGLDLRTTSRTYTTVKGSPATYGTGVPTLGQAAALRAGQSVVFGGLEDSTAVTTENRTPATFRTNIGLVEIDGAPVRVRVAVLLFDGTQLAAGGETAARVVDLAPRQWHQLNAIVGEIVGREAREATCGELRNIQVRVDVVSGDGAVIAYATETDNGTGDTVLRLE
jgi:Leucine-rich repeat (LRR) protein